MIRATIAFASALACLSMKVASASESPGPQVYLSFNSIFDSVCEKQTGHSIAENQKTELKEMLPGLIKDWNEKGTQLLKATEKVVGKPFKRKEFDATLSLCTFPSMSHPLLINMRYSLRSFTKEPASRIVALGIIHHEILHHYVSGRSSHDSALLKKYVSEDPKVKVHLHLLALQQASFKHLGWEKDFAEVIKKDESLPLGHYKRAWQIVKAEGFQKFVDELKN